MGNIIATGKNVWDGDWNHKNDGKCTKRYPPFKTSRQVAGEDIKGLVLKCQRQSVDKAINQALYAPVDMKPYSAELKQLFPDGVCDYSKPGEGFPRGLFKKPIKWVEASDKRDERRTNRQRPLAMKKEE